MALAESGIENSELESSFKYILKHIDDIKDSRTLAYCTVAFATAKRPEADNLMEKLYQMRNEEGDFVWWNNKNNNIYDTETTALAVQAMFRSGQHNATAAKALAWLIRNKDKDGNWVTTQSTIQSLRAIIAGSEQKPFDKAYDITISVNEKPVREISITKENYDVCQLVDLTEFVRKGVNTIEMKSPEGENFSYQIVYEYFIPKENISASSTETLKINLEYDKRNVAVNDILNCRVSVDNNGTETAPMVLLDIGVPPGFEVITDKLQGMKERNEIEQWEIRGQQVILYLREVKAQSQTVISFDMKAKFPIRARTPVSRAYEYYQPEIKSETVPVMIEVEEGKE